jgi:hypothetical protein
MEWYDILRVFTVVFATASLYISARRAWKQWNNYTQRLQELVWAVQAFLVLMIEGSIEGIVADVPGGPRTILSVLISAAFLRAISRDEGYLNSESEN